MMQNIMVANVNDDLGKEVSEEIMHEELRAHLKDYSPQSDEKVVHGNMEARVVSVVKTQGGMHGKTNGSLGEDSLLIRSNHKVSKTHIKIEPQEDDQSEAYNNSILSSIKSRYGVLLENEWPLFVKLEYIYGCGEKSAKKETHLALSDANKSLVSAPSMKEGEILMVVTQSNGIPTPSESNREFKGMTRKDLRAIAKLHKVKGWYRLKR
ncbi:unnamed protein product [Cuscuta europaea]|nr:unnamed protein product [Cuscuta europaea]